MLHIQRGLTAIIGGGGKSTLLRALAEELSRDARVVVATSTKMHVPDWCPVVLGASPDDVQAALLEAPIVCAGSIHLPTDKLAEPRAAFSDLGESLAEQDSVLGDIGEFCIQVFGSGQDSGGEASPALAGGVEEESRFLNSRPDMAELTAHYLRLDRVPDSWLPGEQAEGEAAQQTPQAQTAAPAVGTVLLKANYNGPELPANYTMDQISLGDLETVTPVFGPLWSTYGYRDHPIDGEYRFHNGVDIGAYQGDPILAFAAGTVEYVGENDDHGLYFQIDHGNGIKSFYAHCSRICVTTGQTVSAGEKVAEVGSTGNSTGPHLHLELKYAGTHLDPAYYIDYKQAV